MGYSAGGDVPDALEALDDSPVDMRLGAMVLGVELDLLIEGTMCAAENGGVGRTRLSSSSSGESYSIASSVSGWLSASELRSVAERGLGSTGVGGTTTVEGSGESSKLGRCAAEADVDLFLVVRLAARWGCKDEDEGSASEQEPVPVGVKSIGTRAGFGAEDISGDGWTS